MSRTRPLLLPRRVLMTADAAGGVWTYALDLARGLAAEGVSVVLATMGPPLTPEHRAAAASIPGLVLEESALPLEWMPGAAADSAQLAHTGGWLLDLEARHRPELIHLNGYGFSVLPWQAPCLVVAHSCVLSWWRAVKGCDAPSEWRAYADRVREGLAAARAVVTPCVSLLAELESIYGTLWHARVIRNGRDPAAFAPAAQKEPFVFSAGRIWDEAKNIRALGMAAGRLSWPVVAAGYAAGPGGSILVPETVHWLGPLEPAEVRDWMARARIFCLPARYEPFGLSALEAALSGCALVLGDIPSLRELWGGVAVFVPPNDAAALARTLNELIADPLRTAALGRIARRRGATYTAARMTAGYCGLYDDLLSQQAGGAMLPARLPPERHSADRRPAS